jgi:hypothetical protein
MRKAFTDVINLSCEAAGNQQYDNHPVAQVNDHVIRIATMTEPYHWHRHPDFYIIQETVPRLYRGGAVPWKYVFFGWMTGMYDRSCFG